MSKVNRGLWRSLKLTLLAKHSAVGPHEGVFRVPLELVVPTSLCERTGKQDIDKDPPGMQSEDKTQRMRFVVYVFMP